MRKLNYTVDLNHFKEIEEDIVPILFTKHQFNLIEKRFMGKSLTFTERNEFSRTISKKMNALNKILKKEDIFIYGRDKIEFSRLKLARTYLKKFSRKFRNKHIIITGSFLYDNSYNDIDIFVISKYEKQEYDEGKFHITYFTEDIYDSLFFNSIKQLCISNKKLEDFSIKENIGSDTFISLYQELCNDLHTGFKGVKNTVREFLLQAAFISNAAIPDSSELKKQVDSIISLKKPLEVIKNTFVNAVVLGVSHKKAVKDMKYMIDSYSSLLKEYSQHTKYYQNVMQAFEKVIAIES